MQLSPTHPLLDVYTSLNGQEFQWTRVDWLANTQNPFLVALGYRIDFLAHSVRIKI